MASVLLMGVAFVYIVIRGARVIFEKHKGNDPYGYRFEYLIDFILLVLLVFAFVYKVF